LYREHIPTGVAKDDRPGRIALLLASDSLKRLPDVGM
jgi:hypothetical protein